MVLVESALLGANVHVKSYCDDLRTFVEEATMDKFEHAWNYILDTCCEYNRLNCASATPRTPVFCVRQMIRVLETYIVMHRPKPVFRINISQWNKIIIIHFLDHGNSQRSGAPLWSYLLRIVKCAAIVTQHAIFPKRIGEIIH